MRFTIDEPLPDFQPARKSYIVNRKSPGRISPHPIAFVAIHGRRRTFFKNDYSAVVPLIPADGIENELPADLAPIFQRLAADDIVRDFFDELRRERVERFGIFRSEEHTSELQ